MVNGATAHGGRSRLAAVEVLAQAADAVHGSSPLQEKLEWVAQSVRAVTGAAFVGYALAPDEGGGLAAVSGASPREARDLADLMARMVCDDPELRHHLLKPEDLAHDNRTRTLLRRTGLSATAAYLGVPVPGKGERRAHGVLVVAYPDGSWFEHEHAVLVGALGAHLGTALDNLVTMNRLAELEAVQREVVHQLQEAVRPPMPKVEAGELGVHYLPADPSAPTGGDLYDWFVLPDGDLHLAVVDVVGKGVGATKEALGVTHALRLLVLEGCPIESLVERVNALVTPQSPELVATTIVARYRPADGLITLAGGGHPPALVVSGDGTVRLVSAPGVPVGWPGAGSSEVVTFTLGRQDTLVLYTDGLIEATKDVLAGLDSLTTAAAQVARYPAAHVARALVDRALAGAVRRDDSLALVLRRRTPPLPRLGAPLGPFEYRFSPTLATVSLARHLFGDWLQYLAIDENEAADLLLVGSELCSNAVRNASGRPGGLSLRAWAESDAVVVEVEDDGSGFELADRYDDEPPDPEADQGRGLYLVKALSDELSVRREDGHTVVRAVKRAVLAS